MNSQAHYEKLKENMLSSLHALLYVTEHSYNKTSTQNYYHLRLLFVSEKESVLENIN